LLVIAVWLKLIAESVVLALLTSLLVKIVLLAPVSVSVPVPAVVNDAKLPVAGIEVGIPVTEKVPLQVRVTSSPAAGTPAGLHTIEP
jgi:hypothetical protein